MLYYDNAFVHSPTRSQETQAELALTRPRYFVPVHGEYRHLLGHARLAASTGMPSERIFLIADGAGLEATASEARVLDGFPAGRVLVDGKGIGDVGAVVLRDRQILNEDGVIAVSLAVDRKGALVAGPEIATRGVIYVKENEPLLEALRAAVIAALSERADRAVDSSDRPRVSCVRQFITSAYSEGVALNLESDARDLPVDTDKPPPPPSGRPRQGAKAEQERAARWLRDAG